MKIKTMLLAAPALLALAATLYAQPSAAPAKPALDDLAWMSGHWVNDDGGTLSEETWTRASGDSMLGMWRYVDGGKARVFEILAITREADGIVLRLRHFDPRLVAREDKDTPVALKLVSTKPGEARFEGPAVGASGQIALHYRQKTPDTLSCTLEKGGKGQEFTFRRAK